MQIKNNLACPACGVENPFYNRTCFSCSNYLRDRVVNIDFWSTIGLLAENPMRAFKNIIYAEHKNFNLFLIPLIVINFLIISRLISARIVTNLEPSTGLIISFLILLGVIVTFYLLFSVITNLVFKNLGYVTRFKDNLAIIVYSNLLLVFGLIVLFPLEIVIFGDYLFSVNPTPFQIKATIGYFFFGVELIIILWTVFLLFVAFYTSTKSKIAGVITAFLFFLFQTLIIFFSSQIIFTV